MRNRSRDAVGRFDMAVIASMVWLCVRNASWVASWNAR
ncbi:Uncharacterised protein [Mycobacteroides abscessus subsp. abscessus]|nr:Uncharacterised protein [Mycobacteroides abscessus subsp. abscessus]